MQNKSQIQYFSAQKFIKHMKNILILAIYSNNQALIKVKFNEKVAPRIQ
jgi:hypothetical protein